MKEFDTKTEGRYSYSPIREKINQACKQFKEYKKLPCVLVLSNLKNVPISLHYDNILGSMYGNLNMKFNINFIPSRNPYIYYGLGGKLRNYNTAISAVAVLEKVIPKRDKIILDRERDVWKSISANKYGYKEIAEHIYLVASKYQQLGEKTLRLRVYHNCKANYPLSKDVFCGKEDEQWVYNLEDDAMKKYGEDLLSS